MSQTPSTVAGVRWSDVFPWLILVRAARAALFVRVILLALVGVLLTESGWSLVNKMFDETTAPLYNLTDVPAPIGAEVILDANARAAVSARTYGGPLLRAWGWAMQPAVRLIEADAWGEWIGFTLAGAWAIAVWALVGGAIARIAALYLTQGETIGPVAALRAALVKWLSTAGAPVCVILGIVILAIPMMLAGLLVRADFFALLVGLIWIALILGGLVIAVVAIGLALGWPLMWSTVAVERTDAFDGISRAYAYVYQRPLHGLFFVVVAGFLGLLAQLAVNVFVDATLDATQWAVASGSGEARYAELHTPPRAGAGEERGTMESWASNLIQFWTVGFRWLAAIFPMAYLWPAATGIYLLLRRYVDSTEMTEISFYEPPAEGGLPPLVTDPATGIPRVSDAPPVVTGDDAVPPRTP